MSVNWSRVAEFGTMYFIGVLMIGLLLSLIGFFVYVGLTQSPIIFSGLILLLIGCFIVGYVLEVLDE